jgi:hypothetical protein
VYEIREWGGAGVASIVACVALIFVRYEGTPERFHGLFPSADGMLRDLGAPLWCFGCAIVLCGLLPFGLTVVPAMRPARTGATVGDWPFGLTMVGLVLAVMLPVVYVAGGTETFSRQYPMAPAATGSLANFATYEVGYALFFVAWEFLFRGFLLFALVPRLGSFAVVVQMMPYVLMHFGKPLPEVFASIFAGLALGVLALGTRSFGYGALIHVFVAVGMDLRAGLPKLP